MNLVSVTGKKWILKKFNEKDVVFLKDNYFLDDITAKLIAIKKIKILMLFGDKDLEFLLEILLEIY